MNSLYHLHPTSVFPRKRFPGCPFPKCSNPPSSSTTPWIPPNTNLIHPPSTSSSALSVTLSSSPSNSASVPSTTSSQPAPVSSSTSTSPYSSSSSGSMSSSSSSTPNGMSQTSTISPGTPSSHSVSPSSSSTDPNSFFFQSSTTGRVPSSSSTIPLSSSNGSNAPKSNLSRGPIIGGVIGGLALLVLIAALVYWFKRRSRRNVAPSTEFMNSPAELPPWIHRIIYRADDEESGFMPPPTPATPLSSFDEKHDLFTGVAV